MLRRFHPFIPCRTYLGFLEGSLQSPYHGITRAAEIAELCRYRSAKPSDVLGTLQKARPKILTEPAVELVSLVQNTSPPSLVLRALWHRVTNLRYFRVNVPFYG